MVLIARIGRTVFDAVVDPAENTLAGGLGQAKVFQEALRSFLEACVRQDSCFFEGKAPRPQREGTRRAGRALEAHPLETAFGRPLTQNHALNGSTSALCDKGTCMRLRNALAPAAGGRHLPGFREASPAFGDWTARGPLQRTGRPVEGDAPTVEVVADGAGPVLVIGNTGAPPLPTREPGRRRTSWAGGGVHLTVDGEGHGTYGVNKCLTGLVDAYLLDGTVPGNDTVRR
jgi:hypothetical protein